MKPSSCMGFILGYLILSIYFRGVERTVTSFLPDPWVIIRVCSFIACVFILAIIMTKIGIDRIECIHGIPIPEKQEIYGIAPIGLCIHCDAVRFGASRSLEEILSEYHENDE
jgi:hypothetical protein